MLSGLKGNLPAISRFRECRSREFALSLMGEQLLFAHAFLQLAFLVADFGTKADRFRRMHWFRGSNMSPSQKRPKILIVEDNQVVRLVAVNNLMRFADVEIKVAKTGAEALEQVRQTQFALILMDVHMPEMDGLEATRAIRESERKLGRHTPIVAVTAADTPENCLAAGMDDFAIKPVDYRRILERWLPIDSRRLA